MNSSPPPPELRPIAVEMPANTRDLQSINSGSASKSGGAFGVMESTSVAALNLIFAPMRTTPPPPSIAGSYYTPNTSATAAGTAANFSLTPISLAFEVTSIAGAPVIGTPVWYNGPSCFRGTVNGYSAATATVSSGRAVAGEARPRAGSR